MLRRPISKASKLRILLKKPSEQVNDLHQNKPIASSETKAQGLEWYNDSFLLSNRIQTLLNKDKDGIPKAFDLIQRHAGASTQEVYGKMIATLASQKKYADVLKLNDIILRRNRTLSPFGYTSLFSAISKYAATSDWFHKSNCIQTAEKVWKIAIEQKSISIQTVNAFLHLCEVCCHTGGYNLGWEIFEELGNVSKNSDNKKALAKCEADHITYSMMMGICISASNEKAALLGINLWQNYLDSIVKKSGKTFETVENELISKAILLYANAKHFDQGYKTIQKFYGLSKEEESKLERKLYLSDVTNIIKFCLESKNPSLGLKWLHFVEKTQSNFFKFANQSEFCRYYVKSAIAARSFEKAYKRVINDQDCPLVYRLWICYKAMSEYKSLLPEDMKLWWSRILEALKHPDWETNIGHIYFYMKCGIIMEETESVKSLLNASKTILYRYLTRRVTKDDEFIDFMDFRDNVRKLMRWRLKRNPIRYY